MHIFVQVNGGDQHSDAVSRSLVRSQAMKDFRRRQREKRGIRGGHSHASRPSSKFVNQSDQQRCKFQSVLNLRKTSGNQTRKFSSSSKAGLPAATALFAPTAALPTPPSDQHSTRDESGRPLRTRTRDPALPAKLFKNALDAVAVIPRGPRIRAVDTGNISDSPVQLDQRRSLFGACTFPYRSCFHFWFNYQYSAKLASSSAWTSWQSNLQSLRSQSVPSGLVSVLPNCNRYPGCR